MADSKLYADDHPTTSLKGTGFKDAITAKKTLKLIMMRSSKYQYDVVNTMYNRAKYHPYQTSDMIDAMKIYKKWLLEYKNKKEVVYEFLPISVVSKYSNEKDNIFLYIYKKVKTPYKLQYIPINKDKPQNYDYYSYRNKIIENQLQKIKKLNLPLYITKNNITVPSKIHIKLISIAYSPDEKLYS